MGTESESKIIVISESAFISSFLQPIQKRLEYLEALLVKISTSKDSIYSDKAAAAFLQMSTKKLQHLRNERKIGFIREEGARKITYRHEHLLAYLAQHEFKAKK